MKTSTLLELLGYLCNVAGLTILVLFGIVLKMALAPPVIVLGFILLAAYWMFQLAASASKEEKTQ